MAPLFLLSTNLWLFLLLQSPTFDNGCEYIWELLPKEGSTDESDSSNTSNDLRENINVQFSFDYQRSSTFSAEDQGTFQSAYQLGNLQVKASPCNVLSLIIKKLIIFISANILFYMSLFVQIEPVSANRTK